MKLAIGRIALMCTAMSALACGEPVGPEEVRELSLSGPVCGPALEPVLLIPIGDNQSVFVKALTVDGETLNNQPIEALASDPRVSVRLEGVTVFLGASFVLEGIAEVDATIVFTHRRSGVTATLPVRVVPQGTVVGRCGF